MLRVTQLSGFGIGGSVVTVGRVVAAAGSYGLTGSAAIVWNSTTSKRLVAGASSYSLTGSAASLRNSTGAKLLIAGASSYSLTGAAAVIRGFTPLDLTGLKGWWDASVTASLSLSGSNILTVADQSGGGYTMGQQGALNRPTYSAAGLNSRPAMLFATGSGQVLENNIPFPFGTGNTITVFAVVTMTSSAPNFGRLFSYTATGLGHDYDSALSFTLTRQASTNALTWSRNSSAVQPAPVSLATPFRVIVTVTSAGVTNVYINGTSAVSGTISGNFGNPGGSLNIGGGHFDGGYWDGAVAEIGIATGDNSASVTKLDTYLKNKWGL